MTTEVFHCRLCSSRFDSREARNYCPVCRRVIQARWAMGLTLGFIAGVVVALVLK